jgi:hypothetical protein
VTGQGRWEETIPTETPHVLVCQGSDEWSALYVDGELVRHGDHYLIDEQLRVLFDVITVTTNAFVVTNKQGREAACQTLDEIRELERTRMELSAQAAEKRAEAQRLLAEAEALETK